MTVPKTPARHGRVRGAGEAAVVSHDKAAVAPTMFDKLPMKQRILVFGGGFAGLSTRNTRSRGPVVQSAPAFSEAPV